MSKGKGKTPFRVAMLLPLLLVIAALVFFLWPTPELIAPEPPTPPLEPPALAALGTLPDWSMLDRFQKTITRENFLTRLDTIYSKNGGWKRWITINKHSALIKTGTSTFSLEFATTDSLAPAALFPWKKKATLSASKSHPLSGLHIAIDPGHIGGDFAEIEERHLRYGDHAPIQEGTMTLLTARHLKTLLEQLGAKVSLVRETTDPVTSRRPKDFPNRDQKAAEQLFYRTSEIRARANLINHTLQPDLVLCLHYNATSSPVALPGQDFHIILNGAYHSSEISKHYERFEMLQHLLAGTINEELPLAKSIAQTFASQTGLPAYEYSSDNLYATKLAPYIWVRNLLANRLYQCPVIFMEPYTMNSTEFIKRHEAGDYSGLRKIDGKMRLSVYREYAKAVADGLAAYYQNQ